MSAFSKTAFHGIASAHSGLLRRMTTIHELELNPREVVDAIASPDDLAICARAKELGMKQAHYHSLVTLTHDGNPINVDCGSCSPMPLYLLNKNYELRSEWPFANRVALWADAMSAIYQRFLMGERVLYLLDGICKSPKQVRYLLPGIVTLLKLSDQGELADKISATPSGRSIPALPSGARQAIADYNALIAQASLLPSKPEIYRGVTFNYNKQVSTPWLIEQ